MLAWRLVVRPARMMTGGHRASAAGPTCERLTRGHSSTAPQEMHGVSRGRRTDARQDGEIRQERRDALVGTLGDECGPPCRAGLPERREARNVLDKEGLGDSRRATSRVPAGK
jgi:hypothetical protein